MATIAAPSLSRVAALPALHLPQRKPARRRRRRWRSRRSARRVTRTPVRRGHRRPPRGDGRPAGTSPRPRAAPAADRASARPSTPRDDPARADGREWPSLRWMAAGLAVALPPRVAGGRSRTGSPPTRRRPRRSRRCSTRSGAAEGVLGLGARAAAAGAARARQRAGLDALLRPRDDGLGRAGARRRRRRWCPPRWSRRPRAGCRGPRRRASSGSRRARTAACGPATRCWTSTRSPPHGAC